MIFETGHVILLPLYYLSIYWHSYSSI